MFKQSILLTLSVLALNAYQITEMPSFNKRINPTSENNAVYSYNEAIAPATKAVVNISTQKKVTIESNPMLNDPFFQQFFGDMFSQIPRDKVERSLGSGVIISSDGYIITNYHVIEGADKIIVNLPNDAKEYTASLIGQDQDGDLAVIKINKTNLPFIKFADSNEVKIGDIVFAIGNPFGVGETITQGIVSATNKNIDINAYENFIQTDASINPGNSGGALIDSRGALIGINTAILSRTGGNHGVGFAIPANMVKEVANALVNSGKITRGYIGIGMQDLNSDLADNYGNVQGAVVISIEDNSPAKKAGLLVWDLITAVNGKKVQNSAQLRNLIGSLKPNSKVILTIVRDGKVLNVELILAERKNRAIEEKEINTLESKDESAISGMRIENLSDQIRQRYRIHESIQGVLVTQVAPNSKAEMYGFNKGDVIAQIENMPIKNTTDYANAINKFKGKMKRFLIYTQNGTKTIVVK